MQGATSLVTALVLPCVDFNPRPHAGGDRVQKIVCGIEEISIHAPMQGATLLSAAWQTDTSRFQSTPPCRGRPPIYKKGNAINGFQSTPPCRGRQILIYLFNDTRAFQSTPPCRGRRCSCTFVHIIITISIHAPMQGATATRICQIRNTEYFNPRPHAGGDLFILWDGYCLKKISIHAPMQGATTGVLRVKKRQCNFNPRPHAGGDLILHLWAIYFIKFQSTPPCRGRLGESRAQLLFLIFQSTPPCRGRRE